MIREIRAHIADQPIHRLDASDVANAERIQPRVHCRGRSPGAQRERRELLRVLLGDADSNKCVAQVNMGHDHDVDTTKNSLAEQEHFLDAERAI